MKTILTKFRTVLVVTAIGLGGSCGSDRWEALEAGDPDHPAAREHRARLDIVVGAGTLPAGCDGTLRTCTANQLSDAILLGCPAPAIPWATGACEDRAVNANTHLCVAETLLRLAQAVEPESVAIDAAKNTVLIGPQDAESQAELARAARRSSLAATNTALTGALDTNCTQTLLNSVAASTGPAAEMTQGEHLAHFVHEGLETFREAQELTVQTSVAVADAQRSRATDPAAAEIVELDARASRAYAAHSIVGGADGLHGLNYVAQSGFFPLPRLSAEGRVALQHLRTAAISPVDIANVTPIAGGPGMAPPSEAGTVTIDQLIFGTGASVAEVMQSVRGRLAVMIPMPDLFTATTASAVYTRLGISRDAFIEARAYLIAERRAFDRDITRLVPADSLPSQTRSGVCSVDGDCGTGRCVGGECWRPATTASFQVPLPTPSTPTTVTNLQLYAATRNTPSQPLPAWWSALVRYDDTPQSLGTSVPVISFPNGPDSLWRYGGSPSGYPHGFTFGTEIAAATNTVYGDGNGVGVSYIGALESISTQTQAAIVRIAGLTGLGAEAARAQLGAVLADIGRPTFTDDAAQSPIGRARLCTQSVKSTTSAIVRIDLEIPNLQAESLIVVSSKEALECAVRGTVEGAPCEASDVVLESVSFAAAGATGLTASLPAMTSATWNALSRPNSGVRELFILRQRPGAEFKQPGGYEALTGWMLSPTPMPSNADYYTSCFQTPVAPGVDRWLADVIAPDVLFAGDPAMTCAGLPNDLRLPLENELTDDGNGVENSWRHYLNIAHQAANEADMLGETLVDEGLQMDLRAESAVDELEQICGVSINVSPTQAVPTVITGTIPCPAGYVPVRGSATSCALDPVAFAIASRTRSQDQSALATCLETTPTARR